MRRSLSYTATDPERSLPARSVALGKLLYQSPAASAAASTAVCWSRLSTYPRPESTARPSMPNRTRISRAISTIAWPACAGPSRTRPVTASPSDCLILTSGDSVRVFGTVDRICGDDDVVTDNLLDDRRDRLERVPDRHLERLISVRGHRVIATRRRRVERQLAAGSVGRAVTGRGGIGDEDPTAVHGWNQGPALRAPPLGVVPL